MPLIEQGRVVDTDAWTRVADDAPLPDGAALVTFARLRAEPALLEQNRPLGVSLAADEEPDDLAPFLDRLPLVELTMKTFRDGRAFTQARSLREHHAYSGTIRVTGHVLPDQAQFLERCGVDAIDLPDDVDPRAFLDQVPNYSVFYQRK